MKISVNWLKRLSSNDPAPEGIAALVERIGTQLGAVEEVIDLGKKYQGVTVARIVSCEAHPDADRLQVCKLDDGGVVPEVERDDRGYVQVVCGAPNVRENLMVAWLPPGSTVPNSFDTEPFVLDARQLRGVISNGMLASPRELAIGDSHDGILEIDDNNAKPGDAFAAVYNLDDTIIDIENKMFTHRPDCFGQLGVAREIAGIYGHSFYSPDWYMHTVTDEFMGDGTPLPLVVQNELPTEVPRFMAVAMSDITIKPSPMWLQSYVSRVGLRPINNVVDITNYMMLLTGQPLHAYDYDKVLAQDSGAAQATLCVRRPHSGEKINLLNGKEITPRSEAIMIATESRLIGVGGVMGGADTEVDEHTQRIIVECATFDMYAIRRTAMAHGLFTDAVTRNNKGQSPLQNDRILAQAVSMLRTEAGGHVASEVIDDDHTDAVTRERQSVHPPIKVSRAFINERLGLDVSAEAMAVLLTNVECHVEMNGDDLTVTAPFWRTDIEIAEDVVEEVGRLYGYDYLPKNLPHRDLTPAPKDSLLELKKEIRRILSAAGANEVLTYSFVHGDMLRKAEQDPLLAFQLSNASSPDLQYYRQSLIPSLLDKVHANIKNGYDEFALFEMGKTHRVTAMDEQSGLPLECNQLAVVYTAEKSTKNGAAYYEARQFLVHVAVRLGIELEFVPLDEHDFPIDAPFEESRSAVIKIRGHHDSIGVVGEFKPSVRRGFKLPQKTAGFELNLHDLTSIQKQRGYRQQPRFPTLEQDICFKIAATMTYQKVLAFTQDKLAEVSPEDTVPLLSPIDIYQRPDDPDHKQITLRLSIAHFDRTMTDVEVSKLLDQIAEAAASQIDAERI